jgi:hypothetical protein
MIVEGWTVKRVDSEGDNERVDEKLDNLIVLDGVWAIPDHERGMSIDC